ncbi:DUF2309 domain-containing protein [Salinisphaera sp.]|uniref:YbcC family protein n=1 Tax=Salinisphaera sp. TaxID=1914330 RepID=UPI000C423BD6|nr:DUF2309 domain-containing protein [Salinisphaera sp.]MBS61505.1 DUF2309 domain-containing protein [Salinisphaera sp.]
MNDSADYADATIGPMVEAACDAIAPIWPLDSFIAVNPYWSHRDRPVSQVAARLAALSGTTLLMPPAYYREHWQSGRIGRGHLERALKATGASGDPDRLVEVLDEPAIQPAALPTLARVAAAHAAPEPAQSWPDQVRDQISGFCAAFFDDAEAEWGLEREQGLFAAWRADLLSHAGPGRRDNGRLRESARALPEDAGTLFTKALAELGIPRERLPAYLLALLLDINGWASWCAGLRWRARQAGSDDSCIVDLLAIRLAWEWLLDDGERGPDSRHADWLERWQALPSHEQTLQAHFEALWIWQYASELAYQAQLEELLQQPAPAPAAPSVQAIFCIDVRSEVIRRALENTDPAFETRGFAGFFGLPIQYRPLGTDAARAQLPGLLAPALEATDDGSAPAAAAEHRRERLTAAAHWKQFEYAPTSIFTLVETLGPFYAGKLIRRTLGLGDTENPDKAGLGRRERDSLRPALNGLAPEKAAELAAGILTAMGLTTDFASLVLLTGHGSQSANNPHAAGLDCGACCGQTGEVNARVLARLLNDPAVRESLRAHDIHVPEGTWFMAALHNTTTEEIALFDTDDVPDTLRPRLDALHKTLATAGARARAERATSLGLAALKEKPAALHKAMRRRARDWGQVRPEWGLANNAAFIAAPGHWTRGRDLAGRVFLHNYDWTQDKDFQTLRQIMTAPMVVAHWINMQYYASVVDNHCYGSGNKALHNVVGGHLGVIEGNGGDLRIGLPWQSLHDGEKLMHEPLRLSVCLAAPAHAIDQILETEPTVHDLVANGWLHLFRIDDDSRALIRRDANGWQVG